MSARTFCTGCNQAATRNISPGSKPAPTRPHHGTHTPRAKWICAFSAPWARPDEDAKMPTPDRKAEGVGAEAGERSRRPWVTQPPPASSRAAPTCSRCEEGAAGGLWGLAPLSACRALLLPPPPSPWRENKVDNTAARAPTARQPRRSLPHEAPSPAPSRSFSPRPLPGSERPLAAQAQEAGGQQQAAQRRGQGDDSPHGALGGSSRRSGGRPIVFKAGGGQGEAAMAAQGRRAPPLALRRRHQPPSCLSAVPPNFPLRRRPPCGVGALWGRLLGCPAVVLRGSRVGSGSSTAVVAEGGSWRGAVPSGRRVLVSVPYSSYTLSLFVFFFFCIKCVVTALGE